MTSTPDAAQARARDVVEHVVARLTAIEHAAMVAGDRKTIEAMGIRANAEFERGHDADHDDRRVLGEELARVIHEAQSIITTPQDRVIHLMCWAFLRMEAEHEETIRILRQALSVAKTMTGTRSGFDDADDPEDDLLYLCYARHLLRWGADLEGLADDIYCAGERAQERAQEGVG